MRHAVLRGRSERFRNRHSKWKLENETHVLLDNPGRGKLSLGALPAKDSGKETQAGIKATCVGASPLLLLLGSISRQAPPSVRPEVALTLDPAKLRSFRDNVRRTRHLPLPGARRPRNQKCEKIVDGSVRLGHLGDNGWSEALLPITLGRR